MYLSTNTCLKAFSQLYKISDSTTGKQAGERLSALRYFFALKRFFRESGASSMDLAPTQTNNRQKFTDFVGDVVTLGLDDYYTNNFGADFKNASGYGVSSNFLTTTLKKDGNYPGRPKPLLLKQNEHLSLHPDWKTNIKSFGCWDEYSTHLLVWLSRFVSFEGNIDVGQQIKTYIETTYGKDILDQCLNEKILDSLISSDSLSNSSPDLEELLTEGIIDEFDDEPIEHRYIGKNIIYYGAPGTGKSHTIDLLTNGLKRFITVFHPETQYSDFVGSLKPKMNGTNIIYEFRPGPFTKALIQAYKTPDIQVFLVIEEINRAVAAAVFGELFQLLDRENGESKYEIDVADPDMLDFINHQLALPESIDAIKIPRNLSILATMNSSDQAVMPMDTAFKRRWSFEYIPIDFTTLGCATTSFELSLTNGIHEVTWPQLAQSINQVLISKQVSEDRLLGPYFLTNDELIDQATSLEVLSSKLFVYLWDDVLRHHGRDTIFSRTVCYSPFGEVMRQFKAEQPIFSDQLEERLLQMGVTSKAENSE
ncbi:AAA family ATPase [Vibrio parahaemolyticus]|nr:AAA family ATPase [Vibrio parahaemolyticus]